MDVREGDVIFHCSDGYIQAISRVKAKVQDQIMLQVIGLSGKKMDEELIAIITC